MEKALFFAIYGMPFGEVGLWVRTYGKLDIPVNVSVSGDSTTVKIGGQVVGSTLLEKRRLGDEPVVLWIAVSFKETTGI